MIRAVLATRVVTCDPDRCTPDNPLGVIDNAAVLIENGDIAWIGERTDARVASADVIEDCALVTPALIDAHTHAAWTGSRHDEYAVRMRGGDYVEIAAAGGGIAATQRSVAAASVDEISATLEARLRRMASLGVATVEIKSGYGLLPREEIKLLTAIAAARARADLPRVEATYLALHAIPKSWTRGRDHYVASAVALVDEIAERGLARFVDAYVDPHAFSVHEARKLGQAALARGLGVRLHAGQFGDIGGAELAAELGALSVDHLEHVSARGIEALAGADVAACLLPVASFTLGQTPPPVAALRKAGVRLVVASDANPGTAPTESLPLAIALAVRNYGLSPAEALIAATRNAAVTLRGRATGTLRNGGPADLTSWDLPHETCIAQPWGTSRARLVLRDGIAIANLQIRDRLA